MNYNNWLTKRERYTPQKEAVVDTQNGTRYTYRQLNEQANRLASYLQRSHELKAGDRLAVVSKNSVEYLILFFACAKLGIVMIPLNYRLPNAALKELLSDCNPRVLVCSEAFRTIVEEINSELNIEKILSLDGDGDSLANIMQTSGKPPILYEASANDIAMILYTSGTTGKSKGAMISWRQIHWNSMNTEISLELTGQDSSFVNTPFYHTGGWHVLLTPLIHHGGKLVFQPEFDAEACNRLIEARKRSVFFLASLPCCA